MELKQLKSEHYEKDNYISCHYGHPFGILRQGGVERNNSKQWNSHNQSNRSGD